MVIPMLMGKNHSHEGKISSFYEDLKPYYFLEKSYSYPGSDLFFKMVS